MQDNMITDKEFYLYWDRDELLSFHSSRNLLVINAMREGIKCGRVFPPIITYLASNGAYIIIDGHHRAIAHREEHFPCSSVSVDYTSINLSRCVPLSDVEFDNHIVPGSIGEMRLKISLGHLPRDIAERFCEENGLDTDEFLSQ